MFYLTLMGGSDIRLKEPDNVIITMWGGTEILLPTLAEKIMRLKKARNEDDAGRDFVVRRANAITLMGATMWVAPTVAREIEEMIKLRESGLFSQQELLDLWREAIQRDDFDMVETFTVMGGAGEDVRSLKEELKDLERIAAKGLLNPEEFQDLRAMLKNESFSASRVANLQEKLRALLCPSTTPRQLESNPRSDPILTE